MIGKLERGAYSSYRYYINPVSFKPIISVFKSDDYVGKTSNLGDKEVSLPKIDKKDFVMLLMLNGGGDLLQSNKIQINQ